MVLFGGFSGSTSYSDTWVWKNSWIQQQPATSPSPRSGQGMAYDPVAGTVLLFGGGLPSGERFNDTWTWNGVTWTHLFPSVSPPARDTAGMAYDPVTGRIVLFGGAGANGVLNDTWEWNGEKSTWTERFPSSSPSARRTKLVYDFLLGAIVLFGGDTSTSDDTYFNDTWTWNGVSWTQLFPASSPPARALPAVAYDAATGEIAMFGGYIVPGVGLNDTWTWNGSVWNQRQTTVSPPESWASGVGYDPVLRSVILFGGDIGNVSGNDTWLFVP